MKALTMALTLGMALLWCNATANNIWAISSLPDNAVWNRETIEREDPPEDYQAVVLWFQAVSVSNQHRLRAHGQARVIIDYEKMIKKNPDGSEEMIYERHYLDSPPRPLSIYEGGLYLRDPWYGGNDFSEEMRNSLIRNGSLRINVGQIPNRVAHWWTNRAIVEAGCSYFAEMRVKIIGQAAIQFGADWWRDLDAPYAGYDPTCRTSNNCEAWVSGWYGDTGGKFRIIRTPLFNQPPVITGLAASSSPGRYTITCIAVDYDHNALKYQWDFDGDGLIDTTTTSGKVCHSYQTSGKKKVFCRVFDAKGAGVRAGPLIINVP